ncbi:MAG: galactose mutarotase [Kiritimatiellae bacterium]|nr:galactose mutarotase [Kiritimatiellia bacterium]MDD5520431.1 galactose mutarotase [Kiritimatiellia bacterium]
MKEPFGKTSDGRKVSLYTLTNVKGCVVKITNYGGIVTIILVPDKTGKMGDVALGYDKLEDYIKANPFFGALVGRYGNRICKGKFTLNGREYTLAVNNGENALHGGLKGFDKVVWKAKEKKVDNGLALELVYVSKDMEEGFPGTLTSKVTYTWTDDNELKIDYEATTDKDTIVNLTQHNYYNLAGAGERDNLDHEVMIAADRFTPVDKGLIPTGELKPVKGTPFDFTTPTKIGARINQEDEQLKFGGGYDHNWVLNNSSGKLALAATVYEPTSGRFMEVFTTELGLQFYTGNFLNGTNIGKGGKVYRHRYGFCMETQYFPDSPNKPEFPTTVLKPGQVYRQTTVYRFSTK